MLRFIGALSVVVLIVVVVGLYVLRPAPVVTLGLVFPILTSAFITSTSLVVTYLGVTAYSREGLFSVLFVGCGALVFGCTTLLAAMFLGSEGQNFSATVLAVGAELSAVYHLIGASLTYRGDAAKQGGGRRPALWVSLTLSFVVLILAAGVSGVFPAFYAVGVGTTILDQVILGIAAITFATSAVVVFVVLSSSRSAVLYWYSLALGATSLGLVGIAFSNGDLEAIPMRAGWATLYLGGVLLATSVLSAERLGSLPSGKNGRQG